MEATGNVVDIQFKGRTGIREGLQPALDGGMVIDMFDEDIDRVNLTWGDYLLELEDLVAASDYEATGALVPFTKKKAFLKTVLFGPYGMKYKFKFKTRLLKSNWTIKSLPHASMMMLTNENLK